MKRILLAVLCSGAFAMPAFAQSGVSCKDFLAMDSSAQNAAVEAAEGDDGGLGDMLDDTVSDVRAYCTQNGGAIIADALKGDE
ncbi:MAG: hypothetical protein KDK07_01345 [Bauldia sp.]|nr:hypothetical protein [Bauldia sp.]